MTDIEDVTCVTLVFLALPLSCPGADHEGRFAECAAQRSSPASGPSRSIGCTRRRPLLVSATKQRDFFAALFFACSRVAARPMSEMPRSAPQLRVALSNTVAAIRHTKFRASYRWCRISHGEYARQRHEGRLVQVPVQIPQPRHADRADRLQAIGRCPSRLSVGSHPRSFRLTLELDVAGRLSRSVSRTHPRPLVPLPAASQEPRVSPRAARH